MELRLLIAAFGFGYLACLITVLIGCLLLKLEDMLEYRRIRRKSRMHADGVKIIDMRRKRYVKENQSSGTGSRFMG